MSPFRFSESTRRTLSSGATRAITPTSSIAASSSSSDIALNSAPVIARPGDAELIGDRRGRDGVVAGDHAHRMPASCAISIAAFAVGRGGSTIPTSASTVRPSSCGEQVGRRVEVVRLEVLSSGRHHAQALARQALVLVHVPLLERVVDRHDRAGRPGRAATPPARAAGPARPSRGSGRCSRPVVVAHPVERRHQLVGGVERQLGDARVVAAASRPCRGRPSPPAPRARPRSGRRSARRP